MILYRDAVAVDKGFSNCNGGRSESWKGAEVERRRKASQERTMSGSRIRARAKAAGRGATKYRQTVQWKQTNVQDGVVIVDEHLLTKLIKKEPIQKYYSLDPEPFATGMFASVRRCKSLETGEVLAAKFSSRLRYGEDCTREIHHEIALLSLCSPSPRIVRLHDVFQTPKEFIIVMEYAPGGDMQTIIDDNLVPFESDVVKFVQHVVEGLAYLHHRKIAHLDIKPQNLVMMGEFPDCDIKVCDFEISRVILEGSEIHEVLGTPEYVAPEILHYEPITLAADMWSLGVTTYVLLTGFSPFGGETDQETFLNISRAQVDFPDELFEDVSEEAKDFIRKLLVRKPSARMTAKECLRHPWLANNRKSASCWGRVSGGSAVGPGLEDQPRRAGCQTCPPPQHSHNHALRKYLSKSREALFEKVVCQQKLLGRQQEDLRKTTLLQRYNKTMRLCESQMSLVSKTREMAEDRHAMTRSREKLYGLKCLSKSYEVLDLYKSLVNLKSSDDNGKTKEALPGILKTLTRASTGDFTETINNRAGKTRDESVDNISDPAVDNNNRKKCTSECDVETVDIVRRLSCVASFHNGETVEPTEKEKVETESDETNDLVNNNIVEAKVRSRPSLQIGELTEEERRRTLTEPPSPAISHTESLTLSISTSESDISEEDGSGNGGRLDPSTEEDEPRYTVAQLVSAYNMHQEIVSKTSIEATMSSAGGEIAQSLKFPTGPNALRLFIPDINISSRPKRATRKKTGMSGPQPGEAAVEETPPSVEQLGVQSADKTPLIHEMAEKTPDGVDSLSSRLGVEAPPPKYLRSGSVSGDTGKDPSYLRGCELATAPAPASSLWQVQCPGSMAGSTTSIASSTASSTASTTAASPTAETPPQHKPRPLSNVAKTVELFNNVIKSTPRPDRKSFSSPRTSPAPVTQTTDKIRRKSSPPTMKPCF